MSDKKSLERRTMHKEKFLTAVKDHSMSILKDDGLYRHIKFSNGGSSVYKFYLTTWPMTLCITGDMGDYVFRRNDDMFQFFRNPGNKINPYYWEEKCVSNSKFGNGVKQYCPEVFEEAIKNWMRTTLYDIRHVDRSVKQAFIAEVKDSLLNGEFQFEWEAREAVNNFCFKTSQHDDISYADFWETDLTRYTDHYIWCCNAIVWGINQYDKIKNKNNDS